MAAIPAVAAIPTAVRETTTEPKPYTGIPIPVPGIIVRIIIWVGGVIATVIWR
jgi:hypothetical protein